MKKNKLYNTSHEQIQDKNKTKSFCLQIISSNISKVITFKK